MSVLKSIKSRCWCPLCGWEGHLWEPVESRPSHSIRKVCPQCGSYPRDRIVSLLLLAYAQELSTYKLKLIEFGEHGRAYDWKTACFEYWNIDIEDSDSEVIDFSAGQMMKEQCLRNSDVALMSYVLSMIESRRARVDLLKHFHQLTINSGRLILFDDFSFDSIHHVKLSPKMFFHRLRFGRGISAELEEAGWFPIIVQDYRRPRILSSLELPFLVASKKSNARALHKWIVSATQVKAQPLCCAASKYLSRKPVPTETSPSPKLAWNNSREVREDRWRSVPRGFGLE